MVIIYSLSYSSLKDQRTHITFDVHPSHKTATTTIYHFTRYGQLRNLHPACGITFNVPSFVSMNDVNQHENSCALHSTTNLTLSFTIKGQVLSRSPPVSRNVGSAVLLLAVFLYHLKQLFSFPLLCFIMSTTVRITFRITTFCFYPNKNQLTLI